MAVFGNSCAGFESCPPPDIVHVSTSMPGSANLAVASRLFHGIGMRQREALSWWGNLICPTTTFDPARVSPSSPLPRSCTQGLSTADRDSDTLRSAARAHASAALRMHTRALANKERRRACQNIEATKRSLRVGRGGWASRQPADGTARCHPTVRCRPTARPLRRSTAARPPYARSEAGDMVIILSS